MTSLLAKNIASAFRRRRNAEAARRFLRPVLESLEHRLVLSAEWIHYDYIEDGILQGGVVQVQEDNPLHVQAFEPPPSAPYQSTKLIDNGPSSNRIDLVIVGDGYTASELDLYALHVNNVVAAFFAETPLKEYASFFNVHRVDVISNESGVDNDPTNGISRDTALDARFWCSGIERLLCVNVSKTIAAANNAPDVDQILVLANTTKYGGAGYASANIGTLSGNNASSIQVGLHEFGHSFADLADEYHYSDGATFTGAEPSAANVSTYDATALDNLDAKWHLWLDQSNVSTFEGGMYNQFGIYRPTNNSKMRSLGRPFEQVNTEQFVLSGYKTVKPIDDATPAGTYDGSTEFFVDPVDPVFHQLDVQWSLDGIAIPGATGTTFDPATLNLAAGTYTLSVEVADNTSLVRDETQRDLLLTEARNWTLEILRPPKVVSFIVGEGNPNRSGVAKVALQFDQATTASSATALRVYNHTAGGPINLSGAKLLGNGTSTVTWDLSSVSLPRGRYTAELPAADATSAGGLPLAGTYTFEFLVLPGDANGDGVVNFLDFGVVGSNFDSLSGAAYRAGDADGDGAVGFADFGVIGANFDPLGLAPLTYDLGDAPEVGTNYPTTLVKDGAFHVIGSGLFLGARVDSESDGQPHADALRDDNASNDEDGVTFGRLTAGFMANITVVAAVPSGAVLNAWIDFNADGDWSDPGEQIFTNKPLADSSNAFSFSIPASAAVGDTFARFRVTTSAGYSFTGLAPDGEVEDYKINIGAWVTPSVSGGAQFLFVVDPSYTEFEFSAYQVETASFGQRSKDVLVERDRLPRMFSAEVPSPPRPRTARSMLMEPELIDPVFEDDLFVDELAAG